MREWKVIGLFEGFSWIMQGDSTHIVDLTKDNVSMIHFRGGAVLRTSRANPSKDPTLVNNVVSVLKSLNVKYIVTIGGDDTALSSSTLAAAARGSFTVCHVPKTIDNDLPLKEGVPTFGYSTAREVGTASIRNIMVDAKSVSRWFICVAMGRKAGFLALGMGMSAGATLTIIPEEFGNRPVTFKEICDIVEGTVIKRRVQGRNFGVVVLAEGLVEAMKKEEILSSLNTAQISYDEHDNILMSNIDFAECVRNELRKRMKNRGMSVAFTSKNIGYELRCSNPNAFDRDYTQNLGFGAVDFLANGGTEALVCFDGEGLSHIPYSQFIDPIKKKSEIRMVNIRSLEYEVARKFMIRLDGEDFLDKDKICTLAAMANSSPADFFKHFAYLAGLTPEDFKFGNFSPVPMPSSPVQRNETDSPMSG